jgi:hypothetical protein
MTKKKNENLSGSYADEDVTIIGNTPNSKPIMRDLDTVPHYEVVQAVDKIKRKREKNKAVREELRRQIELEHPTLTKAVPYLQILGVIVVLIIFAIAMWIIAQVNNSYNSNQPMTSFILTKLLTRLM